MPKNDLRPVLRAAIGLRSPPVQKQLRDTPLDLLDPPDGYDYTMHADAVAGDDQLANRPAFIDYQISEASDVSVDCLDATPFDVIPTTEVRRL